MWALPHDALCMFNFKTSLDILGSVLIIISLLITHLVTLVCVTVFSVMTQYYLKASARMSGRDLSSTDQIMTVRTVIQCVSVGLVTIFIVSEALHTILSASIAENSLRWIGFVLLQVTASFNPILFTLTTKDIYSLFHY